MATRHLTAPTTHHKTSTSNKLSNLNTKRTEQNRKITTVPEMSPEARRAILLAREDSKVNNKNNSRKKTDGLSPTQDSVIDATDSPIISDPNNNTTITRKKEQSDTSRNSNLNVKTSQYSSRNTATKNPKISSSSSISRPPRGPKAGTARSRSTLSQNEPPFSMSDNNEIMSHRGTNTASNASVYTSNMSSGNNNNSNSHPGNSNNNRPPNLNLTDVNTADDDDNDSALPNDDSFDDEEEDTTFNKNSFVLALDKALEKSYVNRLKGDITDTARVSKPGTVRALNGGRLTNAQEVVVNVCHNDDTELVFHDDDEESIDTAKAISEIRVNIWMEYNSRFPQDNDVNDFGSSNVTPDDAVENEGKKKREPPLDASRHGRQASASVNYKTREKASVPNERTVKKLTGTSGGARATTINNGASGSGHMDKPKPTNNNLRLRNIPPSPTTSRRSSAASSRGKGNSANSSTTKPTTPMRTRR